MNKKLVRYIENELWDNPKFYILDVIATAIENGRMQARVMFNADKWHEVVSVITDLVINCNISYTYETSAHKNVCIVTLNWGHNDVHKI